MDDKCPVCDELLQNVNPPTKNSYIYHCKRCGDFTLESRTISQFDLYDNDDEKQQKRAILSHHIAQYNKKTKSKYYIKLTKQGIDEILKNPFPTPIEQMENLIIFLGDDIKIAGKIKHLTWTYDFLLLKVMALTCTIDKNNLYAILEMLKDENFIVYSKNMETYNNIKFTFNGWKKYHELKKERKDSKKVFMAMRFKNKKLTNFLNSHVKPEIEKIGFLITKANDQEKPGLIDDRIRVEIRESRFIIVDISDENLGAYWEAGYAEGLGKKVFYICDKSKWKNGTISHFDIRNQQTFIWNNKKPKEFIEKLKASIQLTFPDTTHEDKK